MEVFQPDFNSHGAPPTGYPRNLAILGFFGVLASLLTAGSAFTYAKSAGRNWLSGVVVGSLYAVGLFVVWVDLWEYAGGVG